MFGWLYDVIGIDLGFDVPKRSNSSIYARGMTEGLLLALLIVELVKAQKKKQKAVTEKEVEIAKISK